MGIDEYVARKQELLRKEIDDLLTEHPMTIYKMAKEIGINQETLKAFIYGGPRVLNLKTHKNIEKWCIAKKYELAKKAKADWAEDLMERYAPVMERLAKKDDDGR